MAPVFNRTSRCVERAHRYPKGYAAIGSKKISSTGSAETGEECDRIALLVVKEPRLKWLNNAQSNRRAAGD